MKMRSKVLAITWIGIILVLIPVLLLVIVTEHRYFRKNFYSLVDPLVQSSALSLQDSIVRGSALSMSFSQNESVIDFIESGETSDTLRRSVENTMKQLSGYSGFVTTFLATRDKGSYYIVENGKVVRDQLYKNEPNDAWFYTILGLPDDVTSTSIITKPSMKRFFGLTKKCTIKVKIR